MYNKKNANNQMYHFISYGMMIDDVQIDPTNMVRYFYISSTVSYPNPPKIRDDDPVRSSLQEHVQ